jgi:hypothetical protein
MTCVPVYQTAAGRRNRLVVIIGSFNVSCPRCRLTSKNHVTGDRTGSFPFLALQPRLSELCWLPTIASPDERRGIPGETHHEKAKPSFLPLSFLPCNRSSLRAILRSCTTWTVSTRRSVPLSLRQVMSSRPQLCLCSITGLHSCTLP